MVRGLLSGVAVGAIVAVLGLGLVSVMVPLEGASGGNSPLRQAANTPTKAEDVPDPSVQSVDQGRQMQAVPPEDLAEDSRASEDMAPDAGPDTGSDTGPDTGDMAAAPSSPLAALDDSTAAPAGFAESLPDVAAERSADIAPALRPAPQMTRLADVTRPETGSQGDFTDPGAPPQAASTAPDAELPLEGGALSQDRLAAAPDSIEQIPVPPPGEALAPDLPLAEPVAEPDVQGGADPAGSALAGQDGAEIVLLPDGSQVLPDGRIQKPRVFAAGEGAGFRAAPDVATGRLPQIRPPSAEGASQDDTLSEGPSARDVAASEEAWKAYRAPFTAPAGQALFSVVLLDVGIAKGGLDQTTLFNLGLPLTIAIDPARPDARAVAQAYRGAGYEVAILMTGLPAAPVAPDLDTAMEAWRQAVPEAVALVEPVNPVVQNNRQLSQHLLELAERDGLALITQDRGSNAADQLARASDLPEAKIWRVLDDGRERASHIARELTRAEFEAKRDGQTVVMLSAWPESVAGLRDWASGARENVALAPVSALFDAEERPQ